MLGTNARISSPIQHDCETENTSETLLTSLSFCFSLTRFLLNKHQTAGTRRHVKWYIKGYFDGLFFSSHHGSHQLIEGKQITMGTPTSDGLDKNHVFCYLVVLASISSQRGNYRYTGLIMEWFLKTIVGIISVNAERSRFSNFMQYYFYVLYAVLSIFDAELCKDSKRGQVT